MGGMTRRLTPNDYANLVMLGMAIFAIPFGVVMFLLWWWFGG